MLFCILISDFGGKCRPLNFVLVYLNKHYNKKISILRCIIRMLYCKEKSIFTKNPFECFFKHSKIDNFWGHFLLCLKCVTTRMEFDKDKTMFQQTRFW